MIYVWPQHCSNRRHGQDYPIRVSLKSQFLLAERAFNFRLMEIESRLLPCGLHIVGEPPSAMEAIATLVNIAEIDRPDLEKPIRGLPGILARSIRRNVEEIYKANNKVAS